LLLTLLALVAGLISVGAQPATAVQNFDNAAIADQALTHVGQSGGQCKPFANNMALAGSGGLVHLGGGYYTDYQNAGGVRVSAAASAKGDIIQLNGANVDMYYNGMHTAIVVSYLGSNSFDVVDSNWGTPINNEIVHHHTWNPYTTASQYGLTVNIWQLGNVTTPAAWPGVGNATYAGDHLNAGQVLYSNHYLLSPNGRYALLLQSDGNLVLYNGSWIWQSNTVGSGANRLVMQADGNLVMYSSVSWTWQSGSGGSGSSHLTMQDDGNVVAYKDSGGSIWQTFTGGHDPGNMFGSGTNTLANGQTLYVGSYIRSADKRYSMLLQPDGNLVLFGPGYHVLWFSGSGNSGNRLVMQPDGNLVLYNAVSWTWQSGTGGGQSHAVVQDDGNVVVYHDAGGWTWQTQTSGWI
jgi:hypothetical protein